MSIVTITRFEDIKTPYTRQQVVQRMEGLIGRPFKHLPGNPAGHQVMAVLSDGWKLRASDAEQLYNDWELFCAVYGPDAWDSVFHSPQEIEALPIVCALYGEGSN